MQDIQNIKGDYKFKLKSVGIKNLTYRLNIKSRDGQTVSTVANIMLGVSLENDVRGVNMSRIPISITEYSGDILELNNTKEDVYKLLDIVANKSESDDAEINMEFDYFVKKKAPISEYSGVAAYKCSIHADKNNQDYDYILGVVVPITTLCPCSKAISEYSAHNQRGYVTVKVRYTSNICIEEIIDIVEAISSCEVYPVLKRVDEKFVTEKAYENPRFVEDIVRMTAEKLNDDERISWFSVTSRHQESIHPYDAYASLEVDKRVK